MQQRAETAFDILVSTLARRRGRRTSKEGRQTEGVRWSNGQRGKELGFDRAQRADALGGYHRPGLGNRRDGIRLVLGCGRKGREKFGAVTGRVKGGGRRTEVRVLRRGSEEGWA